MLKAGTKLPPDLTNSGGTEPLKAFGNVGQRGVQRDIIYILFVFAVVFVWNYRPPASSSLFLIMWQRHWQPRQGDNTQQAHQHWPQLRPINSNAPKTCSSHASAVIPGFRGGRRDLWKHLWLWRCFHLQVWPRFSAAEDLCPSLTTAARHAKLQTRKGKKKILCVCLLERSGHIPRTDHSTYFIKCRGILDALGLRQQRNTGCQLGYLMLIFIQSVGILVACFADDKMFLLMF